MQGDLSSRRLWGVLGAALTLALPLAIGCGDDTTSSDAGQSTAAAPQLTRTFGTDDAPEICAKSPSDCGKSPQTAQDRHPVGIALHDLQRSYLVGNPAKVCARMTRAAQIQAGSMAHGTPSICKKDIERSFGLFDQGAGWEDVENPEIKAIDVKGTNATATVSLPRRTAEAHFSKVGGKWKLSGFFGTPLSEEARGVASASRTPFPRANGGPVTVSGPSGKPCPPLNVAGFPDVDGGCEIRGLGEKVAMTVMTPFGAFKFDDCRVSYGLRVDREGRVLTDYHFVDGPQSGGCGDVDVCESSRTPGQIPWKGRIESTGDGELVYRSMACINTCVGAFKGELVTTLVRRGGRWRAEYVDADIGESGFRLDGSLALTPTGISIEPGAAGASDGSGGGT